MERQSIRQLKFTWQVNKYIVEYYDFTKDPMKEYFLTKLRNLMFEYSVILEGSSQIEKPKENKVEK